MWALAHICARSPAPDPFPCKLQELDSVAGEAGATQAFLEAAARGASRLLCGLDGSAQLLAAHVVQAGHQPLAHMAAREQLFSCQVGGVPGRPRGSGAGSAVGSRGWHLQASAAAFSASWPCVA